MLRFLHSDTLRVACTLQVYAAVHSGQATRLYALKLEKGAHDRLAEDGVASRVVIRAIAEGCGLQDGEQLSLGLRETAGDGAAGEVEHLQVRPEIPLCWICGIPEVQSWRAVDAHFQIAQRFPFANPWPTGVVTTQKVHHRDSPAAPILTASARLYGLAGCKDETSMRPARADVKLVSCA